MSSRTEVSSSTMRTDAVAGGCGGAGESPWCCSMTGDSGCKGAAMPDRRESVRCPRAPHERVRTRVRERTRWVTQADLRAHGFQRCVAAPHDRVPEIEPLEAAVEGTAAEPQHARRS